MSFRSNNQQKPALQNRQWLQSQYQSSQNLSARATLHIRFRTNPYPWQRWVFDRIVAPHTARILELGCGPAPLWRENRDRIPLGWRIWLMDLSRGMVEEAAQGLQAVPETMGERVLTTGHDFLCIEGDASRIPLGEGSVDVVVANHMLYHVADVDECLREVCRVLRPGGRLYAATNGANHLHELHALAQGYDATIQPAHWGRQVFDLEQGRTVLPTYFESVRLHRHANALNVTEPGPLAAYMLSGIVDASDPDYVDRFRQYVTEKLAQDGPLHITSESGLFEAICLP